MPIWVVRVRWRDIDTGLEPGELPGPVRERAQSETGRHFKGATADRPVSVTSVEDGKRFLMIKPDGSADQTVVPTSLVVVQNWREELKRLVPTN